MLDSASLVCWLIADRGLALNSTTAATGTGAPAPVTLSGNLNQSIGLVLKISDVSGGTSRGQAKFDVYVDGGTTPYITGLTTGASVSLTNGGSLDLGITAAFPVGTYSVVNAHTYTATTASWTDQIAGHVFSGTGGVTSSPRPIWQGLNNRPIITSNGSNNTRLSCTDSFANTFSGNDTPITVFMVMKSNTAAPGASNPWLNFGNTGGGTTARFDFGVTNTPAYRSTKTDDAASSALPSGGSIDTSFHYSSWNQAGTTMALRVDGSAVSLSGSGAQNVGTCTFNECLLFARNTAGTPSNSIDGALAEVLIYSASLSADSVLEKETYLKSQWRL
ncbi:MAG TPA: hypothetical protein VL494_13795 [Steroidobacteraceae bacterium]|nr:hypothetical protein [Steroidobacteraceae bacterium]